MKKYFILMLAFHVFAANDISVYSGLIDPLVPEISDPLIPGL